MCLLLHFVFPLTHTLSRSFQSVPAKNCKEVLAVFRTQAQTTRNQPEEELLLVDTKEVLVRALFLGCTVPGMEEPGTNPLPCCADQ